MTSKQEKSVAKIHKALESLLKEGNYESFSVSDIIARSGLSRSTFYAHFKSKDEVLESVCTHIFDHVFSRSLEKEEGHDFSKSGVFAYKEMIEHTFYHFQDDRDLIRPILQSSASHAFLSLLRKEITPLIEASLSNNLIREKYVPPKIEVPALVNALVSMLTYYVGEKATETPEEMTEYFFTLFA